MKSQWSNLVGFQLVWASAVGGAARGWWWAGPLALFAFAAWQLTVSSNRRTDAQLLLVCAAVGIAIDTLWVQFGWMRFEAAVPWTGLAPIWIVAMWMGFALTLNHSMAVLKSRLWLGAALGAIGGPLAYWAAGNAWGAVTIADPAAYAGLAVAWAVLTPLLLQLADRLLPRPVPTLAAS
jgi:hypothetical protein